MVVSGDAPPTEQEAEALFAQARSQEKAPSLGAQRPEPVSTVTGMSPSQAQNRAEAGLSALQEGAVETAKATPAMAMRYGVPIGVGIATGGMGALPIMAAGSAAGGIGEAGAQAIEYFTGNRSRMEAAPIAASTLLGAANPLPMAATNPAEAAIVKFFTGKVVGDVRATQGIVNFLANTGQSVAASELARSIESKKNFIDALYQGPANAMEAAVRYGPSVVTSAIGSKAASLAQKSEVAAKNRARIEGERFGDVMVSEILSGYTDLERRVIANGNKVLRDRLQNLGENIGEAIATTFAGAPRSEDIAKQLVSKVPELSKLQQEAVDAAARAQKLTASVREAEARKIAEAPAVRDAANSAAVDAVKKKALYLAAVDKVFGTPAGDISSYAHGARVERLKQTAEAADGAVSEGIGKLFANAGFGINETVTTKADIFRHLDRAVEDKNANQEIKNSIEKAAKRLETLIGPGGEVSRSSFLRIRDDIAAELKLDGKDVKAANRVAGQAYDAIRSASEEYISKFSPNKLEPLRRANRAAAAVFATKAGTGTGDSAIELMQKGDIGGLVSRIEKEGAGNALDEINAYASAIYSIGDAASDAASKRFVSDAYKAIRDHVIDTSLLKGTGMDDAAKILDPIKLSQRVDSLRQSGFPVMALGMGTPDDIRAMARVSSTTGRGMSVADVNEFLDNAARLGGTTAEARALWQNALKNYEIASGEKAKNIALAEMQRREKAARWTSGEKEAAFMKAKADPLVRLFDFTNLNLSDDPSANRQFATALIGSGPSTVKQLMSALADTKGIPAAEALRRAKLAENIRKSVASDVLFDTVKAATAPGDKRANLTQITDIFYGESRTAKAQRESLRELLGKDVFNNFEQHLGRPASAAIETKKRLGEPIYDFKPEMTVAGGLAAGATGGTGQSISARRGYVVRNFVLDLKNALDNERLNTAYLLYVDPVTAPAFKRASYDLNKFLSASPRNLMMYRLAMTRDTGGAQQQQQPQAQPQNTGSDQMMQRVMSQLSGPQ